MTQASHKRARDVTAPAHLGALIARTAHPSNDPGWSHWSSAEAAETRLAAVIETASRLCGSFLDPQLEHGRDLQPHRSYAGTLRMRSRCGMRFETRRPRHHHGTQRAHRLRNPGRLLFSPPLLSQDVALEETRAQAPFDRKLSHYRDEISDLRNQVVHYRPLVWTAHGRPHPAFTRTLQHAADIASNRKGQQMSAKSLQRRRKHEIQIALLRRRAAMTRAVLPNPSARAEWLFAGIIDRALHHWDHVLTLGGGNGDHDHADSETDTAMPDDDDDVASLASQPSESLQPWRF